MKMLLGRAMRVVLYEAKFMLLRRSP